MQSFVFIVKSAAYLLKLQPNNEVFLKKIYDIQTSQTKLWDVPYL